MDHLQRHIEGEKHLQLVSDVVRMVYTVGFTNAGAGGEDGADAGGAPGSDVSGSGASAGYSRGGRSSGGRDPTGIRMKRLYSRYGRGPRRL